MPAHHVLEEYLDSYIRMAGIGDDKKGPLFRSAIRRTGKLTERRDAADRCALFMAWPFLGSRRLTTMLRGEGLTVNRKRVRRLMRIMGIAALGPKPRTTKPAPGHKIYPTSCAPW
jgi:hypothetical protein